MLSFAKNQEAHKRADCEFSEDCRYSFYRVVKLLFRVVGPQPRRNQEPRQKIRHQSMPMVKLRAVYAARS